MRSRLITVFGCLAVALACMTPSSLSAQARRSTAKPSTGPRTPDGHPDLQGTFNVATITPLERPAEYANRLVMTDDEAAAIERYEELRNQKDRAPTRPDREVPPVGGDRSATNSFLESLFRAGGGSVGGYNLAWINPGDRVAIVDGQKRTSLIIDPVDGRVPPMKEIGRAHV